jgi:hypothetical protein
MVDNSFATSFEPRAKSKSYNELNHALSILFQH